MRARKWQKRDRLQTYDNTHFIQSHRCYSHTRPIAKWLGTLRRKSCIPSIHTHIFICYALYHRHIGLSIKVCMRVLAASLVVYYIFFPTFILMGRRYPQRRSHQSKKHPVLSEDNKNAVATCSLSPSPFVMLIHFVVGTVGRSHYTQSIPKANHRLPQWCRIIAVRAQTHFNVRERDSCESEIP